VLIISNVDRHFTSDNSLLAESPNVGNDERLVLVRFALVRTSDTVAQCIASQPTICNIWLEDVEYKTTHFVLSTCTSTKCSPIYTEAETSHPIAQSERWCHIIHRSRKCNTYPVVRWNNSSSSFIKGCRLRYRANGPTARLNTNVSLYQLSINDFASSRCAENWAVALCTCSRQRNGTQSEQWE